MSNFYPTVKKQESISFFRLEKYRILRISRISFIFGFVNAAFIFCGRTLSIFVKACRLLLVFFLASFVLNCSTYWGHRKNDLADIFTAGVESPGYGVGMRIGPLATGFVFQGGESAPGKRDLGTGYGLRGGNFGEYRSQQLIFGILGSEKFHSFSAAQAKPPTQENRTSTPEKTDSADFLFPDTGEAPSESDASVPELPNERQNAKSYNIRYLRFYHNPVAERRKAKKAAFFRKYLESLDPEKRNEEIQTFLAQNSKSKDDYPSSFLYEIEFYIGARYGIRIGFNLAEFFDFLLGFTGVDLLEDDI